MHNTDSISTDCENGARAALSWVLKRRDHFALDVRAEGYDLLNSIKPLGELVLVLEQVGDRNGELKDVSEWAWEQFAFGKLFRDIVMAKPDLIVVSTIYASFLRMGYSDPNVGKALEYFLSTDYCGAIEIPRWRALDIEHGKAKIGRSSISDLNLDGTWLAAQPEPWLASSDTVYAVTHELFYVTDFGRQPLRVDAPQETFIRIVLDAWIENYLREKNFDLVAELLMCAVYCGFDDLYYENVRILLNEQDADGRLRGPAGSAENLIEDDMDEERVDFLRNYHTTLVAVLCFIARRQK